MPLRQSILIWSMHMCVSSTRFFHTIIYLTPSRLSIYSDLYWTCVAGAWNIANKKTLSGWWSCPLLEDPGPKNWDFGLTYGTLPIPGQNGWALSLGRWVFNLNSSHRLFILLLFHIMTWLECLLGSSETLSQSSTVNEFSAFEKCVSACHQHISAWQSFFFSSHSRCNIFHHESLDCHGHCLCASKEVLCQQLKEFSCTWTAKAQTEYHYDAG